MKHKICQELVECLFLQSIARDNSIDLKAMLQLLEVSFVDAICSS